MVFDMIALTAGNARQFCTLISLNQTTKLLIILPFISCFEGAVACQLLCSVLRSEDPRLRQVRTPACLPTPNLLCASPIASSPTARISAQFARGPSSRKDKKNNNTEIDSFVFFKFHLWPPSAHSKRGPALLPASD